MSFKTIELANNQFLVTGTDALGVQGKTVIDGTAWVERNKAHKIEAAAAEMDAAIEAFYAPLIEAQDRIADSLRVDTDPLLYVVEQEASEGSPARERVVVRLDDASVILRAIEQGRTDRLLWVGDQLVVTAAPVPTATPAPAPEESPAVDLDQVVSGDDGAGTEPVA